MTVRIYRSEPRYGSRGAIYSAVYNGEIIVKGCSSSVIHEVARQLRSRGITGKLEMWDHEHPYPLMTGDIEGMAKWTISETDKGGIKKVRWKPRPDELPGRPRTAEKALEAV